MRGIHINDIPADLFLKYFASEDLQDTILERKMVDDVRDYYEYQVTVDTVDYTYYSYLSLDAEADQLFLEAYKDLLEVVTGLEQSDIDGSSVSLISTVTDGQMYQSPVRIGEIYPHRYRFEYESDGEILGYIAVDGSIDTISDITSIVVSDTRDGSNALGVSVNLTLNSSESRYYVYNASTSALLGYIYENSKSTAQDTDSEGRPLYVDESGNATHEPIRGSRFLRHSQALRPAFFPGLYTLRPEEISFSRFLPGVIGLYKQGSSKKLIYHEAFLRTKSYERISLSGEDYQEVSIPDSIKSEMPTVGDTYSPDAVTEYKLRDLLDFSSVRRITCSFQNESTMQLRLQDGVPAPQSGDPLIVRVERNTVNYENVSYSTDISGTTETIEVESEDLELTRNDTLGKTFLRIPVKRELSQTNSRYFEPTTSYVARLFVFNDTTKLWESLGIEQVYSVTNESIVVFSGGSAYIAVPDYGRVYNLRLIAAGTKVFIASTGLLKKVNSTSTALESATAINNYIYVPSTKAMDNSQPNTLYQFTTSWANLGVPRITKPSNSELYDEYVKVGTQRFSVSSYSKATRPVDITGLTNPTIRGKTYEIKTDSTNPVYSLGYIEYEVNISASRTGVEYFGQASSISGRTFTLAKYAPTYSDTGVSPEDFDLTDFTESAGTYTKTYYIRDFADRSFAAEVTETISKSGDNADDTSTPLWTEFIDREHTYTDTGSLTGFTLASGKTGYRTGTTVSSSSTVERFESRFSEFEHSLVDGSFRISSRGDLVPGNTLYELRKRVTGEMAVDFINRPGSGLFTVSNVGKDANAPMKMRVYCEALLAMATATSLRETASEAPRGGKLVQASELRGRVSIQRIDAPPSGGIKARSYDDASFSSERTAASSDVSSLNAFQRLRGYEEFATNESRFRSSFESRKRSAIMSDSTSSQDALDDIVNYDKTTSVKPVSKSEFRKGLRDTISGLFFGSETYSQNNFYVNNYRSYYKAKLDSTSETYPEADGSFAYKLSLSRSSQASDPADLISRILSRFDEQGNESEWRVV